MLTLTDAISTVASYLREMGYTTYSLKISLFDSTLEDGAWAVSGTFQNGFLGEYYKFDIVYEPDTATARKLDVVEIPARVV